MKISTDRTPREHRPCICRVHLSYDGEDNSVVSVVRHIHKYPKPDGIVFNRRDLEIEPGNPMLRCPIEHCDVYIVIFSEKYPTRNSRLSELVLIVKAAAASADKVVIPVFYGVGTDDVKLKTEKYNEQLRQHIPGVSEATLQEWKDALLAAARKCGFQRKTRDADLCRQIVVRVQDLFKQKDATSLTVTISGCPKLQSIAGLGLGSTSPTFVTIDNCGIRVLFNPSQRINLTEKMTLRNCDSIEDIPFEQLKFLKELDVEDCSSIVSLSGVTNAGKLQQLRVRSCQNFRGIEGQEWVREFSIHDCGSSQSLIPRDKSEMQQPRSSQGASSSSSSMTETTQQDDAEEKLTLEELNRFLQ